MSVVVRGKDSYFFGSKAYLIDEERDTASEWASKHIVQNPAIKWVLGRYVEADNPNNNNQMWALEDLRMAQPSIQHAPMNIVHQPRNIVGAFVATEMLYPMSDSADGSPQNPYVEALGAFWKYYFPEEMQVVQRAHDEGQLFFSMECVAETVTFISPEGAMETFPYKGPMDESYGDWGKDRENVRQLNKPHFTAGALIIPPVKPGWSKAEIKELSKYVEEHSEMAQEIYEDVERQSPEISAADCERITLELLAKSEDFTENSIKSAETPLSDMKADELSSDADNNDSLDLSEGGDVMSKTYTQEEYDAVVEQVEAVSARLAEIEASAEQEAVEARFAEVAEKHAEELAELQSKLDAAVLEAEAVKAEMSELKETLEKEAAAWVEAAEIAERREDRLARVKEVASFPEDYLEANVDRWAAMDEDTFEASLADYASVSKAAASESEKDDEVPAETALETERETASAEASAVRGVLAFRAQGIDPRTV